jgi:hypothetical protein
LKLTTFSDRELEKIPDSLQNLPISASTPQLASLITRLNQHDPKIVEVFSRSSLHAEMLLGRFTARIFLMLEDADDIEVEKFRKVITSSETPTKALLYLPHQFSG